MQFAGNKRLGKILAEIIKPFYFRLRCHKCKCNAFEIVLNSKDPIDIKGFYCLECDNYFDLEEAKIASKEE